MFIAELTTIINKNGNNPNAHQPFAQINKYGTFIQQLLFGNKTKCTTDTCYKTVEPQKIMQSIRSQTQKTTYYMIPYMKCPEQENL